MARGKEPPKEIRLATRTGAGMSAMVTTAMQREIAEVQAAMIVARMSPRDYIQAVEAIKNACARPELAKKATYAYARGGTDVRGPSIRLAEVMAQHWGNVDYGMKELEQREDESTVEAFCWDLETNVRQRRVFQVPHIRYSKEKGNTVLTDPRDIYEVTANMGSRRVRACILGVIPREVQDEAVAACEQTLKKHIQITPDLIKSLLAKFAEYGVTKEQIEAKIQRKIDAILPMQVITLGEIYNALKDGMASPEEYFKPVVEKGTLSISDLKAGHAKPAKETPQENLKPDSATESGKDTARRKADEKKRAQQPLTPAPNMEGGNPNYGEGDDGDPFAERQPGQEG